MKKQSVFQWGMMLALGAGIFVSCQKGTDTTELDNAQTERLGTINSDFSAFVADPRAQACKIVTPDGETLPRAAAYTSTLWSPGQVITVSMQGGTTFVRQKVEEYAKQWEDYANVTFNFVPSNGMIRVTFINGAGSYSYIGTDALRIPSSWETMNFGWFDNNTPDSEFSRTVLHEFGHALGLMHEHQHPDADLDWDREFVYQYYAAAPNYWSRQMVDNNLLNTINPNLLTYNTYDQLSIMHYPIAGRLINSTQGTPNNFLLSAGDIDLVGQLYPF